MQCVRIENGRVAELLPFAYGLRHYYLRGNPQILSQLAQAPDEVKPNWVYEAGEYTPPQPVEEELLPDDGLEARMQALESALFETKSLLADAQIGAGGIIFKGE